MAEGAALVLLSGVERSDDDGGGEDSGLSPSTLPPRLVSRPSVGNWPCACGHRFRVLTDPLTFWAQNSRTGYQAEPSTTCVSCGADLAESFGLEAAQLVSASLLQ